MKKVLHVIWNILEVLIIIYVIALTTILLAKNKFGFTQLGDYVFTSIESNDVNNIIDTKQGDLLIVKNTSDINKGDVIYYYAVYEDKYILCSDVVKDMQKDDYSALYTISDGTTVHSDKTIGKYTFKYHKLGNYFKFLQSRVGFLFFVLLPIMVVFIYQIYDFAIVVKYDEDDDEHDDDGYDEDRNKVEPEIEKKKFKFDSDVK